MNMSNREIVLGWMTVTVLLLGGTYWFGEAKVEQWKEVSSSRERFADRVSMAERVLGQENEWKTRLEELRGQLPSYPLKQDVTSELLRMLERTASEHSLILLRREPEDEEQLEDIYQVAINCTWEGKLEPLVGFLYAIQTKGAILDVRALTVSPVSGQAGKLKGGFTVDCAFSRGETKPPEGALQVEPVP